MGSDLRRLVIDAPTRGVNTVSRPHMLPKGFAQTLHNLLPWPDERVVLRGPFGDQFRGAYDKQAKSIPSGIILHNDKALIGFIDGTTQTGITPVRSALFPVSASGSLAAAVVGAKGLNYVDLNGTSAPSAILNASADISIGTRYCRLGAYTYATSFDTATAAVDTDASSVSAYRKPNYLIRWDGTTSVPVSLTHGPRYCLDVKEHYQRLFVVAACDPDGSNYEPSNLYYSDVGGSTGNLLTDWQDSSPAIQYIGVGATGEANIGLGKAGGNLIIFKANSIYALYGYSASTFLVRNITKDFGCIDPESIIEWQGGCMFMSQRGLMYYDGSSFTEMSEFIRPTVLNLVPSHMDPGSGTGQNYYFRTGRMDNDHIGFSYGSEVAASTNGSVLHADSWMLYPKKRAWCICRANANVFASVSDETQTWSGPTRWLAGTTRFAASGVREALGANRISSVNLVTSLVDLDSSNTSRAITALWRTPYVLPSQPGYRTQGHRGDVQFRLSHLAGAGARATVSAAMYDTSGTAVGSTTTGSFTYGASSSDFPVSQRYVFDRRHEIPVEGVYFQFSYNTNTTGGQADLILEFYEASFWYQDAQQSRSS